MLMDVHDGQDKDLLREAPGPTGLTRLSCISC